jgi:hypothetical protein
MTVWGGMEWSDLAQDTDQWWLGSSLVAAQLGVTREGLSSMELVFIISMISEYLIDIASYLNKSVYF